MGWWSNFSTGDRVHITVSGATVTCGECGESFEASFEDTGEYGGLNPLTAEQIDSFLLDHGVMCTECGAVNKKYGHVRKGKK